MKNQERKIKNTANKIISELKEILQKLRQNEELSEDKIIKVLIASAKISSILPPLTDQSLTEIDDTFYDGEDKPEKYCSNAYSEKLRISLAESIFTIFNQVYILVAPPFSNVVNITYLQLLENISNEHLALCFQRDDIHGLIEKLIERKTKELTCHAVRILSVVIKKNKEIFYILENGDKYVHTLMLVRNFSKLHIEGSRTSQRILSWLARQSTAMFDQFNFEEMKLSERMEEYLKYYNKGRYDWEYVKRLLLLMFASGGNYYHVNRFYIDHLYQYFMSARDEDEKLSRMINFMKGCYHQEYLTYELLTKEQYIQIRDVLVRIIVEYLTIRCDVESESIDYYTEDMMIELERCYPFNNEPYVSQSLLSDAFQNNYDEQKISDIFKRMDNRGNDDKELKNNNDVDSRDPTFGKLFLYDGLIRCLHLMSILYTCCMTIFPQLELKERENDLFRHEMSPFKRYVQFALMNPTERGKVPYIFQILTRKCPFLFISIGKENMIEDLAKMLAGEEIDEVTEEKLYYSLHNLIPDAREIFNYHDSDSDEE